MLLSPPPPFPPKNADPSPLHQTGSDAWQRALHRRQDRHRTASRRRGNDSKESWKDGFVAGEEVDVGTELRRAVVNGVMCLLYQICL